jgi:alpha-glucosidase
MRSDDVIVSFFPPLPSSLPLRPSAASGTYSDPSCQAVSSGGFNQPVISSPWWRHGVIYQVYLRSFADGNGDGTGDIAGLRSRLDYLRGLGVDGLWINPWYLSPLHDGGYDVADYRDIDPRFGTLEEATDLIAEARRLGLEVMVDLVPNHTSSEHPWFRAALASPPGSPERARYHFRPGTGAGGAMPPNDWRSVFGGPAWTQVPDGDWYLHLFDVTQPDLNWANPEVRSEFRDILRFWLDRGASGFRVDVAHGLAKDPDYPDLGHVDDLLTSHAGANHPYWDRPQLHEIVKEWRSVVDEYPGRAMVAEAWVDTWAHLALYLRPDEYHQAFDFEFLMSPWEPSVLKAGIVSALAAASSVGSVPTWVLSNHDVVRHTTRYGLPQGIDSRTWLLEGDRGLLDSGAGTRRARAALLLELALPGSVYLYQGEELGLPEVFDLPLDVLDDPVWDRSGHKLKGRDGSRVPIPWTVDGASHGFGDDGSWLPHPAGWGERSVEAQEGVAESMLELYREALSIRRSRLTHDESLEWLDLGADVLAFRRAGTVTVVVNFGTEPVPIPGGEILLVSGDPGTAMLTTDTAAWIGSGSGPE